MIWTISFNKKTAVKPYWSISQKRAHYCTWDTPEVNKSCLAVSHEAASLDKIHEGHQGIVKCREPAKTSVWWPGLSREVYLVVEYVFLTLYRGGCYAKDHQIA